MINELDTVEKDGIISIEEWRLFFAPYEKTGKKSLQRALKQMEETVDVMIAVRYRL